MDKTIPKPMTAGRNMFAEHLAKVRAFTDEEREYLIKILSGGGDERWQSEARFNLRVFLRAAVCARCNGTKEVLCGDQFYRHALATVSASS
jgi:hypothetical protein